MSSMPLFMVLFNCLVIWILVHIKQAITTVVPMKMMLLLVLFAMALRKEFMWVVSANVIKVGMMMVQMNNVFNVTWLGIYLLLLLKFVNSSTSHYESCDAGNAANHCLICNSNTHKI